MTDQLEEGYRALGAADVSDLDDHEVVVDFPHDVLDNYRTDWGRGCFDESFARRLPVMVWNHNQDLLIGAGVRTENLGDRSRVIGRFADFDAVPQARAAHSLIADKIVPGFSFHYRNGRTIKHPSVRGAHRYVKADMLEFSPVTFPSIPGAQAVGIRSQEATTLDVPDIATILRLRDEKVIDEAGMRALIVEHHPTFREHITITEPAEPDAQAELLAAVTASGVRDLTITIGADGTVSTSGGDTGTGDTGGGGDDGGDTEDDPGTLAAAVDAALDEAARLIGDPDTWTSLPDNIQQALALVTAAGVAVDELLDVMGVDDPDATDTGARADTVSAAPWNFDASAYNIDQLKKACLIVQGDGSTKAQCKLPVRTPDGTLNKAAVQAAAAVLAGGRGGVDASPADKQTAANKLMGLYSTIGEKPPASLLKLAGDDKRSDPIDPATDPEVRRAAARLADRFA
jgi:phage head maturation protease